MQNLITRHMWTGHSWAWEIRAFCILTFLLHYEVGCYIGVYRVVDIINILNNLLHLKQIVRMK